MSFIVRLFKNYVRVGSVVTGAEACCSIPKKLLKIWTPEKIAVIILKLKKCGSTIEKCVQKVQMEWQTL